MTSPRSQVASSHAGRSGASWRLLSEYPRSQNNAFMQMTGQSAADRFPAATRRYLGTKLAHILHRVGGAWGGCDTIDERGADDHPVGERRYEGGVGRRRDAKTNRERFIR